MPDAERAGPSGIFVPVTTPFDPVTGDIAPVPFRENLRRWTEHALDGVVLFGSTGEGVLLDEDEKARLIEFAHGPLPADTMLVAGAGAESTRATRRQAERLGAAGADAVLVHPPTYFPLSASALRDHYLAVTEASPVPVIVYHIPKYTGVTLPPGLVGELAEHPDITGLKDSSGDLKRFADYTTVCGPDFGLLAGSGALLYSALELGAAGGVVALGLLAPGGCAAILREFRDENPRRAGRLQERLGPVHNEIVGRHGVPGVKAALDLLGYAGGAPRSPLRSLPEKKRGEVARVMQEAELL